MSKIHKGPARSTAKERSWRKHIADQVRSGVTARAYCQAHGLSEPSFYGWRRELARRDRAAKVLAPPCTEGQVAEVVLTGAPPVASGLLQIHLQSARIEVFSGCNRETLEMKTTPSAAPSDIPSGR